MPKCCKSFLEMFWRHNRLRYIYKLTFLYAYLSKCFNSFRNKTIREKIKFIITTFYRIHSPRVISLNIERYYLHVLKHIFLYININTFWKYKSESFEVEEYKDIESVVFFENDVNEFHFNSILVNGKVQTLFNFAYVGRKDQEIICDLYLKENKDCSGSFERDASEAYVISSVPGRSDGASCSGGPISSTYSPGFSITPPYSSNNVLALRRDTDSLTDGGVSISPKSPPGFSSTTLPPSNVSALGQDTVLLTDGDVINNNHGLPFDACSTPAVFPISDLGDADSIIKDAWKQIVDFSMSQGAEDFDEVAKSFPGTTEEEMIMPLRMVPVVSEELTELAL